MAGLSNNRAVTKYKPPKSINGGTQAPNSAAIQNPNKKGYKTVKTVTAITPTPTSPSGSTSEVAAQSTPAYNPPTNPNDPFATPAYTGTAEQDPRDSTYWNALSKLQFTDRNEYAENLAEQSKTDADYAYAKQQALQQHKVDQRKLGESVIGNGLEASGFHDREEAEQTRQYTEEGAHRDLSHSEQDAAFAAARRALVEGYGIEQAALMAEAGGRYAANAAEEAEKSAPELLNVAKANARTKEEAEVAAARAKALKNTKSKKKK